ncbi:hypothetical protein NE237_027045 [Protea cynaroides]|uniref:Vesicle tethering protein Uso1/P115-like head domain-containing protein n=1 Tax=Protea cynaroides TaxID=273540 RepID=A0A9Q0GPE1_9MAGN|nr:hypothetical protein NE237_027045 [Protea cynaroides]
MSSLGGSEPLMHLLVKYLILASPLRKKKNNHKNRNSSSIEDSFIQPIILQLLVTWLADCPKAVYSFLDSRPHLTFLLELVSSPSVFVCVRGLAAVLLGECVIYNKSGDNAKDSFMVVDAISQKIGLTSIEKPLFLFFYKITIGMAVLQWTFIQRLSSRNTFVQNSLNYVVVDSVRVVVETLRQ